MVPTSPATLPPGSHQALPLNSRGPSPRSPVNRFSKGDLLGLKPAWQAPFQQCKRPDLQERHEQAWLAGRKWSLDCKSLFLEKENPLGWPLPVRAHHAQSGTA